MRHEAIVSLVTFRCVKPTDPRGDTKDATHQCLRRILEAGVFSRPFLPASALFWSLTARLHAVILVFVRVRAAARTRRNVFSVGGGGGGPAMACGRQSGFPAPRPQTCKRSCHWKSARIRGRFAQRECSRLQHLGAVSKVPGHLPCLMFAAGVVRTIFELLPDAAEAS